MGAKQAEIEKEYGNEAYKKKNFDKALKHYDKAIKLNSKEIIYYTNKGAAFLEMGKFQECIIVCLEGVNIGKDNRASPESISKAFCRIANAYLKQNNNDEAIKYFKKALEADENPKIRDQLNQLLSTLSETEKSDKENGDDYYRKGEYAVAIKFYNAAIEKDPENAILYSNRAQCFYKLKEFILTLSDAEDCILRNPDFVKGHLRKGFACLELKEYGRAMLAFETALKLESTNTDAQVGYQSACSGYYGNSTEIRKRALEDPEIRDILAQPEVRMVLENIIQDSKEAAKYIKSDDLGSKLEKLVAAGILQLA